MINILKKLLPLSCILVFGIASSLSYAQNTTTTPRPIAQNMRYPAYNIYHDNNHLWSMLFFRGEEAKQRLGQLFELKYDSAREDLYTVEITRTLNTNNAFRRFFSPIIDTVQLAANMTYRTGKDDSRDIVGFNPYIIFRWTRLPWNHYLYTTAAISEGVSYVSNVPVIEKKGNSKTSRFLNYLMFEMTFSLPSEQQWQLAIRVEHRSGAYGLYGAGNSGSSAVGLGIRYVF